VTLGPTCWTGGKGLRGMGATRTPEVGDRVPSPGATVIVDVVTGRQARAPFTFAVGLCREPVP
jgi:hypothetical protein